MIERRKFIGGLVGIIAAPAIVRASSLMPVRSWEDDYPRLTVGGVSGDALIFRGMDEYGRPVVETLNALVRRAEESPRVVRVFRSVNYIR